MTGLLKILHTTLIARFTFSADSPAETQIEKSLEYISREVSYPVNEGTISGTLTIPLNDDYPLLILIQGGGKHDRDYKVFNHKPFLVMMWVEMDMQIMLWLKLLTMMVGMVVIGDGLKTIILKLTYNH
ncbi:MAG: hypothetical protein ISR95_02085 [Candidatus Marinimicrobia bacterium]|nr:hypothetical protein [Candidatus Neomarinimicrobiota bacterium]